MTARRWKELQSEVVQCRQCQRLVVYRQAVAVTKRRAYRDWTYWGRPVPSWGDPQARLLLVGLAPGAHGANRTGRMFTGDGSGEFLYAALHRAGFCNQPTSRKRGDGLKLSDAYITNALRCVPPQNRPLAAELKRCEAFFRRELVLLERIRVVIALGGVAWKSYLNAHSVVGGIPRPKPRFGHNARCDLKDRTLLGCYHPSRQNTQTGRLTTAMLDEVLQRASQILAKD